MPKQDILTSNDLANRSTPINKSLSATTTAQTHNIVNSSDESAESGWLKIQNTGTVDAKINLDEGDTTNFVTVKGGALEEWNPIKITSFEYKVTSGTATLEAVYGVQED